MSVCKRISVLLYREEPEAQSWSTAPWQSQEHRGLLTPCLLGQPFTTLSLPARFLLTADAKKKKLITV